MTNRIKLSLFCFLTISLLFPNSALAVVDPLLVPNNKFGIHIISPAQSEIDPAAALVDSSGGDWGYLTILIESKDRNTNKWQEFFNVLRRKHLIPIIRLATQTEGDHWKVPYEGEEVAWADFLNTLNWPVKNRYIVVYNEPNHAKEWGGTTDPKSYAQVLDKTVKALKAKSPDFFILNSGFDASAPSQPPDYYDELKFMTQMNAEVPGIFEELDGWASHSYPNPGFLGKPTGTGRGSVRTWIWEQQILNSLGVKKKLPIFITETGWKHSMGQSYERAFPTPEEVGDYFQSAFNGAWSSPQIVAVTPFLLNYQDPPFDHFSFKKFTGQGQNLKILGATYPEYYPHYQAIVDIDKTAGKPQQENKFQLTEGSIYSTLVSGEKYNIKFKFKNIGASIWGDSNQLRMVQISGQDFIHVSEAHLKEGVKVEPNQEAELVVSFTVGEKSGSSSLDFQLYSDDTPFNSPSLSFFTTIKAPVSLVVKTEGPGNYLLGTSGAAGESFRSIQVGPTGASQPLEARYLLPDYSFNFTLSKPFYQPKTISFKVRSGVNTLDFGSLNLDPWAVLVNPVGFFSPQK